MSCLELFFTITLQNCPFCPLSYLLSGNLPNLIISSTVARLTTNLLRYFLEKGHLITSKQKKHRLTLVLLTNVNSFFTFSKLFSSFPAFSICSFFLFTSPLHLMLSFLATLASEIFNLVKNQKGRFSFLSPIFLHRTKGFELLQGSTFLLKL